MSVRPSGRDRRGRRGTGAGLLALLLAATSSGATEGSGIRIEQGIEYARPEGIPLSGDLFRDESDDPLPAVVLVHGGGFLLGSREWWGLPVVSRDLASAGYAVFNVNYRLKGHGGVWPEALQDVTCAVHWLRAHAAEQGIDGSRIAIVGASVGGFLALMAAFPGAAGLAPPECAMGAGESPIQAVVTYNGVSNWETLGGAASHVMRRELFGRIDMSRPEVLREASPTSYVDDAPPTLVLHGTRDRLVPCDQADELYATLRAAGRRVWYARFAGVGHGFIHDFRSPVQQVAFDLVLDFLDAHLEGRPLCPRDDGGCLPERPGGHVDFDSRGVPLPRP